MKNQRSSLVLMFVIVAACGQQADQGESPLAYEGSNSLVADPNLSQEGVNSSLTEAIEAMADSHEGADAAALALDGGLALRDGSSFTKSCKEEGETAVVSISGQISRDHVKETKKIRFERTMSGSTEIIRTWSQAGKKVACHANGKKAQIDWKGDVAGLKLAMTVAGKRESSLTINHFAKGKITARSSSFSVNGSREINWTAQASSADNIITREKQITTNVTRSHSRENSKGEVKSLELTTQTKAGAPLVVEVKIDAASLALKEKTVKSGTLVLTRKGDGYIESSYENLELSFAKEECNAVSGSVISKFYKEGQAEPAKTLKFEVVDGDYKLTNVATGEEFAEFDYNPCSFKDFTK